eukprot:3158194-Pyramimonas_sp.AAC.2
MAKKDNYGGVSPKGKLLAQAAIGGLFAAYAMTACGGKAAWSVLRLPGGWQLPFASAALRYLVGPVALPYRLRVYTVSTAATKQR